MENIPFNSDIDFSKSTIRTRLYDYLSVTSYPEKEWSESVYPIFQEFNAKLDVKLTEQELREIFDVVLINFKESRDEKKRNTEEEVIRSLFKKNKKQGTFALAKYIVQKFDIITVGEKEREVFIYQDGIYFQAENKIIYPEIQRVLGDEVDRSSKGETISKIHDMTHHDRSIFTSADPRYIPLANGVYDFQSNILLPHSSEYRFKYKFPIIYNPEATCPNTEAFLKDILNPTQQEIVLEWIGYYFYRIYMFKKAIIFVGAGDTGKTTLLEVITYLLGRENISSISLHKMSSDKFSAAHLYEKHGNIFDELSVKDITDTGAFKMATGGGTVTGEYKFGNQFNFHNFSKFTFACNQIPDVQNTNDEAYFLRWVVIRFENTIKKVIPNFINTLKTEEERSGLFNLAMVGLRRLLDNQRFSYYNNADDTKNEMMRSGSSLAMFVQDMLITEWGNTLTRDEMYDAYVEYCQKKKLAPQTKEMLGRRLTDYANYVSDGTTDIPQAIGKPKKARVWRNVKLRVTEEKKVEQDKTDKEFNDF